MKDILKIIGPLCAKRAEQQYRHIKRAILEIPISSSSFFFQKKEVYCFFVF